MFKTLMIYDFIAIFYLIGINSVSFDEEFKYIVAMKSVEGETVPLRNKVLLSSDVEVRKFDPGIFPGIFEKLVCYVTRAFLSFFQVWLNGLALEMKETLKKMLLDCVDAGKKSQRSIDPSLFPSQVVDDPIAPLCSLRYNKKVIFEGL